MMKKPIVIYGAGRAAEKFYCLHHDKVDVRFLIDRMADRTFHGHPVMRLGEAFKIWEGETIVVATDRTDTYSQIRNMLLEAGLKEDRDYVPIMSFVKLEAPMSIGLSEPKS